MQAFQHYRPRGSHIIFLAALLFLGLGILEPLRHLFIRSVTDDAGHWIGLHHFKTFFADPILMTALTHSLWVSGWVTFISVSLSYMIAYGLTHCRLMGDSLMKSLLQIPLFVPSLFPCLGLIYLLGEQGILKPLIAEVSLYGPLGVIFASVIFTIPHATMVLTTSLSGIDPNLYRAAESLGASPWRKFTSVTLPNTQYGLISASFIVFTLTMTDFGIAKVLGGAVRLISFRNFQTSYRSTELFYGCHDQLCLSDPNHSCLFD